MPLILLAVVGALAGYVATRLMRVQVDLPTAMGIGVIGALVGGVGLRVLMNASGWIVTFVVATLTSMALIWLWKYFRTWF
ncbi:GlsB/YeaQ/YmgE family stress response membrane protein [Roseicitreum antarcticum]|uniref:Transglycosylase associated protein n=1 Tax=Roseicitreum antarcticum TaxID=564137 RepID=A0A1H3ASM0_9RHOB|nr:GlsB/YeaQ/YmgE family stress response membrane protein [Roseicitreum antarcticum]SDX32398.1 hypothetical protein SAMN04488238_107109 [Roseicitreum antarcticum]